jgi:hypothetical protein
MLSRDLEKTDLSFSLNITRVITSRKMRWAEHVARMGEKRTAYKVLVGNLEGRRLFRRHRQRREKTLKRILKNRIEGHALDLPG